MQWEHATSLGNFAGRNGGGMYVEDCSIEIGFSSDDNNVNNSIDTDFSIQRSYFCQNTALQSGGGLYVEKASVNFGKSLVEANAAKMGGGACISISDVKSVEADATTHILSNVAVLGGGLLLQDVHMNEIYVNISSNVAIKFQESIPKGMIVSQNSDVKGKVTDIIGQDMRGNSLVISESEEGGLGGGIYATGFINVDGGNNSATFNVEHNSANAGGGLLLNNPSYGSTLRALSIKKNQGLYDNSIGGGICILGLQGVDSIPGNQNDKETALALPALLLDKLIVERNGPKLDGTESSNILKGGGNICNE